MPDLANNQITMGIRRIKDILFFVNENLYNSNPSKQYKVEFQLLIGSNPNDNSAAIMLRAFYHYDDEPPTPENTLFEIQVQNEFIISDLSRYFNSDNIVILPPELIITLVSLSISHTRALLAKNTSGTVYHNVLLPLINAEETARHFFPYMFSAEFKPPKVASFGATPR